MLADITIAGYRQKDVAVGFCALAGESNRARISALKKAVASPVGVRDAILEGREVHFTLKGLDGWPGGNVEYAFKANLAPEGRRQARHLHKTDPVSYPADGRRDILGVCHAGRLDADGNILDRRLLVLNDLDSGHVVDRLLSFLWEWHAQMFGQGPYSATGEARLAAQHLSDTLPAPHRLRTGSRL